VLDQQRIGTEQSAIEVGIAQLRALLPQITRPVIVLADRWYAVARFVCACGELGCAALIRLKRNRKLYRAAPPKKPKQRGAPCKHGPLFQGTRPETYGPADAEWEGTDEQGKRFSQEHGYRFLKQDLLWAHAHLRTPEQVECWSWIVACACNQLLLSKLLGLAVLRPWENTQRAVTPRQVRRVMPCILQQLGTPAQPPKPRGKSPGWRKGRQRTPAPRFPVVRKPKPVPKTSRKRA
jgi:hypothetical protein